MILNIYSIKKPVITKEIRSINLKTKAGELTILDHHLPLIVPMVKGLMKIIDAQDVESVLDVNGGIVEVRPENKINILIES
jgi:F0F1-type ATP synthase epsilon subunit